MTIARPSASLLAFALVTILLAAPAAAGPLAPLKSVGEILLDDEGRASGQNVAGLVGGSAGLLGSFTIPGSDGAIFDSVSVDGLTGRERIEGAGTPTLSMSGAAAKLLLHDNVHSVLEIEAHQPTTVTYRLAHGISATQEGVHGAKVRLMRGGDTVGYLVAVGAEGERTRGEVLHVKPDEVAARLQSRSEMLFIGVPHVNMHALMAAVADGLAEGEVASQYVTEFEGSSVATSEVHTGEDALARTEADARGAVESLVAARPSGPTILVYQLAYETLPAKSADDVAVFIDGELARRVLAPGDALREARAGIPVYYTSSEGGRTQVLAGAPGGGEHRVVVTVGAQASTEPQARAESDGDDDARVYGSFEHHANGKLTGAFLTSVLPEERATLLGFTALATRTEVFRNVSIDGGAGATFRAQGDQMRIATAHADLTLSDDAHATMTLAARAPTDARYDLAPGVRARSLREGIVALEGPHGPAGALVLLGEDGALFIDGDSVRARLEAGGALLYRAAPDAHGSEPALLAAIADGRVGAQLLAGVHDGAFVTKATSYSSTASASIRAAAHGAIDVGYAAQDEARAFALDVRGGALAAQGAGDVRVLVDGALLAPSASAEDALGASSPTYFAQTSAEGALRIIVQTAAERADVRIESRVEESAREGAGSDAFGAFRLFGDGRAVGSYVSLKADAAAGAVSGLSTNARGAPIFASLAAGRSPYASVSGDGASLLTLENDEARIEVSDSTNAFTKIVARAPTDAAFRLAGDLRAQQRSSGVVDIVAADGEHVASLVAAQGASLVVRSGGDVRASLSEGGELVFRTHDGIESELSAAQRAMMNQAIAAGRVAGQVSIHAGAAASSTYGDMTLLVDATRERVDVTLDSATETGRTLIISLDPQTIPGMAQGKASIRFDGELAQQASSYADILDANDDAAVSEYFVLAGEAGTQVLVSVPHFSVHTVTLEQEEGVNGVFVVATVLLAIAVVIQSIFLARKRRANQTLNNERRP